MKVQSNIIENTVVVVVSSSIEEVRFFEGDVTLAHSPAECRPPMQLVCRPPAFPDLDDQDEIM